MAANSYVDQSGKRWHVVLDLPAVERVYNLHGIDIYSLEELGKACNTMRKFLPILHTLVAPELPYEDFFLAHHGDTSEAAVNAFLSALENFYPSRLSTVMQEWRRVTDSVLDAVCTSASAELANSFGQLPERLESLSLEESPSVS